MSVNESDIFKTGREVCLPVRVTARDQADFRRLSGDENPLHHDAEFARRRGFEGPVVFGGLVVAAISRLLGNELPGAGCVWHTLDVKFFAPLYVDQDAKLTARATYASAEHRVVRLEFSLAQGERVLASGRAQAGLPAEAEGPRE